MKKAVPWQEQEDAAAPQKARKQANRARLQGYRPRSFSSDAPSPGNGGLAAGIWPELFLGKRIARRFPVELFSLVGRYS